MTDSTDHLGSDALNVPALLATYQLRQREYLLRITRAMTSRLDLPSLLTLILNSTAEMVGCRAGLLVLDEASSRREDVDGHSRFRIRATYNIPTQYVPAFAPLLDIGAIVTFDEDGDASSAYDRESIFVDLQDRVREVGERLGAPLGQVLGIPLLFEDELLGIIYLFRGEYAFTQMDWQLLQGFANQAAIAVRNARLYEQLDTERSRLATIVENSADGIMILNTSRTVEVVNPALAAMLDIASGQATGRAYSDILVLENVTGSDLAQVDDLDAFFANDGKLSCEGDLMRPGGRRLSLAVTYTPIKNEQHQLLNVIVNIYDITRFREEEEVKSTFTSIISHELKTPVALIKGYAQTLAREDAEWDADIARQSLEIIEEEADRLESLINNLLDVSRIQASGLRLEFDDVDMQKLAATVAANFRTQTQTHTIELDFPNPLPAVWGDKERLRQVLNNLVGNAIKYSPAGGVIRIGGWCEHEKTGNDDGGERVVVYVADQGIGIPAEELPQVFERFYRVDSSLRRSTAGTGLGLFLCKAITEAHGGDMWVRSQPDQGSTFFVALPIARPYLTRD